MMNYMEILGDFLQIHDNIVYILLVVFVIGVIIRLIFSKK